MATWTPDPTFYPSPRLAAGAPPEKLAYVASFDPARRHNDEMAVVDLDDRSPAYGQIVGRVAMPGTGDELHHFGWNACSSCLCPNMPHPHVERRYLIVPGLRSSRIPARREIRPQAAFLGSPSAKAPAGDRSWNAASAHFRAAAGARSDQGLWFCQLRPEPGEPVVVDLDLVSRRQCLEGQKGH
jgi:hypothetical protein